MAAMQVWMCDWTWPGFLKFLFLNSVTFGILFASYHLMVRSTWIGSLLNGRMYPFVLWRSGNAGLPDSRNLHSRGEEL